MLTTTETTTNVLKGALVGAGKISSFHLRAWGRIRQAEIVAIADPDLESAKGRAEEFGIDLGRVYASLDLLLQAESDLNFVDIATTPEAHSALIPVAAGHGLHILCQKPFAPSLSEARAMIETCQRAGVTLAIHENWRWRSWYRAIKRMISEGKIGRPAYARFFSHWPSRLFGHMTTAAHPAHRRRPRMFFKWGIHLVDVSRFLFGEADCVYARMAFSDAGQNTDHRAVVTLAFGELIALIDINRETLAPWGVPDRTRHNVEDVRIEGDEGTIVLVQDPQKGDLIRLTTAEGELEQPAYDCEPIEAYQRSYVAAQSHFVECLLSGRRPETSGEDNLNTLAVTLAAYQSARHNVVVRMQDHLTRP